MSNIFNLISEILKKKELEEVSNNGKIKKIINIKNIYIHIPSF